MVLWSTYPEKNLLEQGRKPTTNSTHIFRAEKRSAQASAHPLLQAQGRLLCLLTVFGLRLCLFVTKRVLTATEWNAQGVNVSFSKSLFTFVFIETWDSIPKTWDSILESFKSRESSLASRGSSLEWLSTYFWAALYVSLFVLVIRQYSVQMLVKSKLMKRE